MLQTVQYPGLPFDLPLHLLVLEYLAARDPATVQWGSKHLEGMGFYAASQLRCLCEEANFRAALTDELRQDVEVVDEAYADDEAWADLSYVHFMENLLPGLIRSENALH